MTIGFVSSFADSLLCQQGDDRRHTNEFLTLLFKVLCHVPSCPLSQALCDTCNVPRVRSEDEDGAVHPGPEERGGGRPLPGTGGGEAARLSALPQHGVRRGLGHRGVVSGQPKLLDRFLTRQNYYQSSWELWVWYKLDRTGYCRQKNSKIPCLLRGNRTNFNGDKL